MDRAKLEVSSNTNRNTRRIDCKQGNQDHCRTSSDTEERSQLDACCIATLVECFALDAASLREGGKGGLAASYCFC